MVLLVLEPRGIAGGLGGKVGTAGKTFEDMKVVYWVTVSETRISCLNLAIIVV